MKNNFIVDTPKLNISKPNFKPNAIFAMLAYSKNTDKNMLHHFVATTYFTSSQDRVEWDTNAVFQNLKLHNIPSLIMVFVYKDVQIDYHKENKKQDMDIKTLEIYTNLDLLFSEEFKYTELLLSNLYHALFIFEGSYEWSGVCDGFKKKSLVISGGSDTKRHILSPIQYKFAIYLSVLNINDKNVVYSYHNISKESSSPNYRTNSIKLMSNDSLNKENKLSVNDQINSIPGSKRDFHTHNFKNYTKSHNSLTCYTKPHTSLIWYKKYSKISSLETSVILNENIPMRLSNYLIGIKEILDKSELDNELSLKHSQEKIEKLWVDILKDDLSNNKLQNVLRNKSKSIFNEITEFVILYKDKGFLKKKFPDIYNELTDQRLIFLTFSLLLSHYNKTALTSITFNVSEQITRMLYYDFIKPKTDQNNQHKISYNNYLKEIKMDDINSRLKLGAFFVELFCGESLEIFTRERESYDDLVSLKINPEYTDKVIDNMIIHPNTLPMICKPVKWSKKVSGGFLQNKNFKKSIITGSSHHGHKLENMATIYNAINYLNNIKFSVNSNLLKHILNEGRYLINTEDKDEYVKSLITLSIAYTYKDLSFYLTTNCDWRGRIYTQSFYLDYQGNDMSTALLELDQGQVLDNKGIYYLYIYGANCYGKDGLDKLTFDERYNWVIENKDQILQIKKEFILEAESPILFTAFCLTMKDLDKNPKYPVRFPISLDATCSGIQHFAGLLLDFELASQVNLIKNDKVNDFYKNLVKPINKAINHYGIEHSMDYSKLIDVKLSRKELKSLIMTKSYNVTTYGMKGQLMDKFEKSDEKQKISYFTNDIPSKLCEYSITLYKVPSKSCDMVLLNEREIMKMASIINDNIFTAHPSLNLIYKYLLNVADIMNKLSIPISWITPSGLKLTQKYAAKKEPKKIKITFLGKQRTYVVNEWDINIPDKSRQINGIIPNIIHSFDASHLINLLNSYNNNNIPVLPVHDCFGTHPNYMNELASDVRKQFVLLYSNGNFLENFHEKLLLDIKYVTTLKKKRNGSYYFTIDTKKNSIIIEIPEVPKMGSLELKQIEKSNYMIS